MYYSIMNCFGVKVVNKIVKKSLFSAVVLTFGACQTPIYTNESHAYMSSETRSASLDYFYNITSDDTKFHDVDLQIAFGLEHMIASDLLERMTTLGFIADLAVLPHEQAVKCGAYIFPVGGEGAILDRHYNVEELWLRAIIYVNQECRVARMEIANMQTITP